MSVRIAAINGREAKLRHGTLNIQKAVNVRSRMSGTVIVEPGYRPEIGQSIGITKDPLIPGARAFNGTSSVLSRGIVTTIVNNYSIGIWARPRSTSGNQALIVIGKENAGYGIRIASGSWEGTLFGVASFGTTAAVLDEWAYLHLRRLSGTSELFVNGVQVGTTSASAPSAPSASGNYVSFGARRNSADNGWIEYFDGDLAHAVTQLEISAGPVLSNAQILAIAKGGPGGIGLSAERFDPSGTVYLYYPVRGLASPEPDTDAATSMTVTSAPAIEDGPLVASLDAELLFSGEIEQAPEGGIDGTELEDTEVRIAAQDFQGLPDRKVLVEERPSETLKARLTAFVAYLSAFGVTLDPSQDNGPTLEARSYDYVRMSDALTELSRETGRIFRINALKVASMYAPASLSAPFDITDLSVTEGDITVEPSRSDYADKVYLRAGDSRVVEKTDSFTGDGSTDSWTLTYPHAGNRGYVTANGVFETLGVGAQWSISGQTLTRNAGNLTNTHVVTIIYDAQFPIVVESGSGDWDVLVSKPDLFDIDAAQALADAEVAIRSVVQRRAKYQTRVDGLEPGMAQDLDVAERGVSPSAEFVITEVTVSDGLDGDGFVYGVTAVDGGDLSTWQSRSTSSGGGGGGVAPIATSATVASLGGANVVEFQEVTYSSGDLTVVGGGGIAIPGAAYAPYMRFAVIGNVALVQLFLSGIQISGTVSEINIALPFDTPTISGLDGATGYGDIYDNDGATRNDGVFGSNNGVIRARKKSGTNFTVSGSGNVILQMPLMVVPLFT